MKKGFIIGLISGFALIVIGFAVIFVGLTMSVSETLIAESFNAIGAPELKLSLESKENTDLSFLQSSSAEEIASFLSQGNEQKKNQYLAILESGLDVEVEVYHREENTTSYNSFVYSESGVSVARSSSSTIDFESTSVSWEDSDPLGIFKDLQKDSE